ncbi:MAG TPA: PLP-dependent aminotransferase family protein [Roseiflexaceae bacterium]|nr:PLP-dependent aminotransferase family protein [Roseiflexaceae bacterium]
MQITVDKSGAQPLYLQIAHEIQRRIRSGALPAGARLPTVRELSRQLGITRLTVHSAYSELQAGGWVEATVGRGTFVALRPDPALAAAGLGQELSARGVLSDMLRMAQVPGMRSLAMADAAPEFYPARELERALAEALEGSPSILSYTTAQGEPALRTVLGEVLRERGIKATPDELLITSGVTQGLALIAETLARPGDAVIVEQPTYLGALNTLGSRGLRLVGAPLDDEGLVVEALEPLILAHRPRFLYTMPTFHNPSGACMSLARRAALLELAARHGLPLVEDDIYGLLAYEGAAPPPLKASDREGLVLYLSSFSKSLFPGVRIGYVAAAPQLIGRLAMAKQADDLCSSPLLQRALAIFVQRGWLASHLRRVIPRYRERRDALLAAMARHFPAGVRWTAPSGGFCSWVALPPGVSPTDLYLAAIERGVAFAPGDVFFVGPAPQPFLRLSFATQPPEVIADAAAVLGELLGAQIARRTMTREAPADYVPLV